MLSLTDDEARWLWGVLIGASWGHVPQNLQGADNFEMAQGVCGKILASAHIWRIEDNGHGRVVREEPANA